jgi:hypothetical protein
MRDAPDVIFVVAAYLSAHNARAFGARDYIAQLMFNSPPGLSDRMDLAKMLACLEMAEGLQDSSFRVWRQTRIGLLSHPLDDEAARGHIGAATYLQMALKPHIVHVVGHTEADHAATAEEVIAACRVARRAIENALHGQPDMTLDPLVQERKLELLAEAKHTLAAICQLAPRGVSDPLCDAQTLARSVTSGVLDAPHLRANPFARGQILTRVDERGACVVVDEQGRTLPEAERTARLLHRRQTAVTTERDLASAS